MSRITFVEMPAQGHVNPSLPVVRELVRRGEQVSYFCGEEFRTRVEQAGAEFRAYPAGVLTSTDIAEGTQSGDLTNVPRLILRATGALLPFLLAQLPNQRPDAVVLDSNALWGHMAAKLLQLPRVSLMTTLVLPNTVYRQMSAREWAHALRPMLPGIPSTVALRSRLVRRFGTAAIPERPAFPARGGLNIALVPRDFQPESALVDDTFRFVGPMIDPEIEPGDTTDSGPLVYVSLGTLHRSSTDFFRACFAAFADLPARFLLSVGRQTDVASLGEIPTNCTVRPFVAQLDVLRQASAFVSHGGMNSVLESLYHAVPLVVVPQQIEQLAIGLHVTELGAAVVLREHLSGRPVSAAALRGAVERVLSEPGFDEAATTAQQALRATGGYRQAADEIQGYLARSEQPVG